MTIPRTEFISTIRAHICAVPKQRANVRCITLRHDTTRTFRVNTLALLKRDIRVPNNIALLHGFVTKKIAELLGSRIKRARLNIPATLMKLLFAAMRCGIAS